MRPHRIKRLSALLLLLTASGCGYVHVGRLPSPVTTIVGDEKLLAENSGLRTEKKILQQELALTRAQGDALRSALDNRTADGDTSKRLTDKLTETSRELAALRTSYQQLQTERGQAIATATEATALKQKLGATEEQLAQSLRTYTQLQEEVARLRTAVDRTQAENVALSEQVKTISGQNAEAQAALAQLNTDLLAQKDARLRAEQDAATLRTALSTLGPETSALAQQRTGAAADARGLLAEHAAETAALKGQIDTLRQQVDQLGLERSDLKQRLLAQENAGRADVANVEAKLATVVRDASLLREENGDLREKLSRLKNAAAGAVGADALRDQLRDIQALALALTEENQRLKARLASNDTAVVAATPASDTTGAGAPAGVTITARRSPVNAMLVTTVPAAQRITLTRKEAPNSDAAPGLAESGAGRLHVVSGGDSLAKISTQYYGTPSRWRDILAANRDVLGESNNLVVGRTLRIP
jgi:nucleoid-associated protein YgaU